jgi:hypothetical protein
VLLPDAAAVAATAESAQQDTDAQTLKGIGAKHSAS